MLRGRLPDDVAEYPDPVFGIDLRSSLEDLQPGQAEFLKNCYYDGGVRKRAGAVSVNSLRYSLYRGCGGTKVYPNDATPFRLIAYGTALASVTDAGAIATLTTGLTSDRDTRFQTWTLTDATYVCNGADPLAYVDNITQVYATVTGTNIPPSPTQAVPFLDRLFVLQDGIVLTSDPRTDTVFASTSSIWAAYKPVGSAGGVKAMHLHSVTGQQGDPLAQLLFFKQASVSALTGTDLGDDVTAATIPSGYDGQVTLIAHRVGTNSPRSIVTAPGIGTFWVTQDLNVAWLPFSQVTPLLIGDALYSRRTDIYGLNHANNTQLDKIWMVYHDRKLKLGFPVGSDAYPSVQYWLDVRKLQGVSPTPEQKLEVSWSGPHQGQTPSHVWVEAEGGDSDVLYGLEGDPLLGAYLYRLNEPGISYDTRGIATTSIVSDEGSHYHTFGAPGFLKYLLRLRIDAGGQLEHTRLEVRDLHGQTTGLTLQLLQADGTAFSTNRYGNGINYGTGKRYGQTARNNLAWVDIESQIATASIGDALQLRVHHATGTFVLNRVLPQVQVLKQEQVS